MRCRTVFLAFWIATQAAGLWAADAADRPFRGVTHIFRTETAPRNLHIHIVKIDLTAPGIGFKLTPPGGTLETVRQTTLAFLREEHAQIAINGHFFLPFPSSNPDASLVGFAASDGKVYSAFEKPAQSYAIVADAPALNIDASNRAGIVHRDRAMADGRHIVERVTVWNALAGSAEIVTDGAKTIPRYGDAQDPGGLLTPGGPNHYSNARSWYDVLQARTAIGLSQDRRTLFLFTVDVRGGSAGMPVGEVADMLIREGAFDALNLDGGGSTTLAMENPATHVGEIVNVSSDNPGGRAVGSNLAVFAAGEQAAGLAGCEVPGVRIRPQAIQDLFGASGGVGPLSFAESFSGQSQFFETIGVSHARFPIFQTVFFPGSTAGGRRPARRIRQHAVAQGDGVQVAQ
jgi:exopolysaccharide biosynthesis protein